MPFLDAGAFIGEAIDSVRAQTTGRWELLLIDDGSTDDSSSIARAASTRDPQRIRYFDHPDHDNRGKSTSRNLGISHARGEFLTFLDADDVFLPDKLERQIGLLRREPDAVMVYGNTQYWWSWDGSPGSKSRDRVGNLGVTPDRIHSGRRLLARFLQEPGIVPCICAVLARTEIVRRTALYEESIQDLYEDQVFLAKMLCAGAVYVEAGCGERYRQHAGSTSAQAVASGRYHPTAPNDARRAYLDWLADYVAAATGGTAWRLQWALWRARRPYRRRR